MPADSFKLIVVTPQRQVLAADVRWVDVPAESGAMRALPEHAPTLGVLGEGAVRYESPTGAEQSVTVHGGFFEVLGDKVTILADRADAVSA